MDAELDELRGLSQHSRQIIAAMEERERKRTGIGSLKIRYNQVFGFYLEVSKPNLPLVPADFERKQTLVNAERFTTPELKEYEQKVLAADERIAEIERRLFAELRAWVAQQSPRLRRTAMALAQLDVLANLARLAAARNYQRPEFTDSGELFIVGGRHPVIEQLLEQQGQRFVPNALFLNSDTHQILLITGPNMGGKSTYLRQTASDRAAGADGLVRSRRTGAPAVDRSHLHAHRRLRQSGPRALHVPGGNERSGRHPESGDAAQPGASGRSRSRHVYFRRPLHRLGRGRAPAGPHARTNALSPLTTTS